MSYISSASIAQGKPLLNEGETVGTEKSDKYGVRLVPYRVEENSVILLDLDHPGVKDAIQLEDELSYQQLFDLGAMTITDSAIEEELVFMADENLLGDPDIIHMEIKNRKVDRFVILRSMIRCALDTEALPESYLSTTQTVRDVWDQGGINSDKLTVQSVTCPVCFTVRSINGPCLCSE